MKLKWVTREPGLVASRAGARWWPFGLGMQWAWEGGKGGIHTVVVVVLHAGAASSLISPSDDDGENENGG